MRCLMANTKHEDAIMKMGFGYFRESILKRLGIDYEFVAEEPTELIELQIRSMYMDFTFLTTEDFYVHFEFQTTETNWKDLQRCEDYDADKIFQRLKEKMNNGEALDDEDFAGLALAPLMSGKQSRKEKIKEAIYYAKQGDTVTAEKTVAILYTLADKFLKGMEKGMDRMAMLTSKLLKEKRLDDLQKAIEDKGYCEQLMKEYHIA